VFRLMLVTDRHASKLPLVEAIARAIAGGVDAVQLRERDMDARGLFALAEELRRITRDAGAALVINHRTDVALAVEADGVHLGWRSVGAREARRLAGETLRIGVSCHSQEQLRAAERDGADYAMFGPVFRTPSKKGLVEPLGVERLAAAVAETSLPIVAVGGIDPDNVTQARSAGAEGVAVIRAILESRDPGGAAARLRG